MEKRNNNNKGNWVRRLEAIEKSSRVVVMSIVSGKPFISVRKLEAD